MHASSLWTFFQVIVLCSWLMVLAPEKLMLQTKRSRANYKKRLSIMGPSQLASYNINLN